MTAHTVDEALERFQLINGAGSEADNTACVTTALSWVEGCAWTDHPPCSHPLLATIAIQANDAPNATPEQRAEIVRAGETGLLDTWWVPTEVVVWAIAQAPRNKMPDPVERCLKIVGLVADWKTGPKSRADLSDADLSRADLSGADLSRADLSGADLRGADLSRADLRGAVLSRADLRDADLSGADLSRAVLSGADLSDADLSGADLSDADLSRADLSGADLSRADLRGADLSDAVGNAYTRLPSGYKVTDSGLIVSESKS